jgi:hypothetical protein
VREKIVRVIFDGQIAGTARVTPDGRVDIQLSGGPIAWQELFEAVGERSTEGLVIALLPTNVIHSMADYVSDPRT